MLYNFMIKNMKDLRQFLSEGIIIEVLMLLVQSLFTSKKFDCCSNLIKVYLSYKSFEDAQVNSKLKALSKASNMA